jgi:4-hydroxy-3-polyprenylbenzoate decarboxylase
VSVQSNHPLVVALTGASGAPYAMRLLASLLAAGRSIELVISPSAAQVLHDEVGLRVDTDQFDLPAMFSAIESSLRTGVRIGQTKAEALRYRHYMDWHAGIASGTFQTDGMVICPCSMSTLGAIANGLSTNLIQRAADVHLKERRKLVLVPRETPLNLIQLENMTRCVQAGAILLPAMPGWYHHPRSLDDMIDFVVARICDQLEVPHQLSRRWGEDAGKK